VAVRLRQAIAMCDAHTDERTADCLEEVLDEVERQRTVLRGLVPDARP
jgi:DNA-binding ferritin-like protein